MSVADYRLWITSSRVGAWRTIAGYYDVVRTLRHPQVVERPTNHEDVLTCDLAADGCE
jgi:NTE family protein